MAEEAELRHPIPIKNSFDVVLLILDLVKFKLFKDIFGCDPTVCTVQQLQNIKKVFNSLIVIWRLID